MQHTRKRAGLLKSALLGAATLGALSLAGAGVAQALPISLGLATTSGSTNITTVATGAGSALFSGAFGPTTITLTTGNGSPQNPQPKLAGNVSATFYTAGTLYAYVTETGLSSSLAPPKLASAFSISNLDPNITNLVEKTYIDPGNTAYALTVQMGLKDFPNATTSGETQTNDYPVLSGPYSLTEVFTITSNVTQPTNPNAPRNSALATGEITTSNPVNTSVPEPGSLALLGTGLLGLGFVIRRRRRKA